MDEMIKHGEVERAALHADLDRKTARKYIRAGKLPSELATPRTWRTRDDPFVEVWPALVAQLQATPALEAKTLFAELQAQHPDRFEEGQLRTLQRHVQRWRAQHGPDQEVFFAQAHRPGEAAQTDFTWATELGITLAGLAFVHMLCHVVRPYSNWEWATVCLSESMAALRRGIQGAFFRLGRVPTWHQTDNSTAATHDLPSGKRAFNEDYVALMRHLGMQPRTTAVGAKEQNGDVEAGNGAFKRRLTQALLVRGSRDFADRATYEQWVQQSAEAANRGRARRLAEDLAAMRPLVATRLPEWTAVEVPVSCWSTIAVARGIYSVPARLIGVVVTVHVFEDRLDVRYGGEVQLTLARLRGQGGHRINYRHVIWSLVQKPGAFARYKYRDDFFPTLTFRRAYDAFQAQAPGTGGDLAYLRVLHLAARTLQDDVETALGLLLDGGLPLTPEAVQALVTTAPTIDVPALVAPVVDLTAYDALLPALEAAS
jgi:hypothetical protein